MKQLVAFIFLFVSFAGIAQVTTYFSGADKVQSKDETAALYSVKIYPNNTRVTIELIPTKNRGRMNFWSSRNTVLVAGNMEFPIIGFIGERNGETVVDTSPFSGDWGWSKVKKGEKYHYTMVFDGKIPPGITTISIIDKGTYSGAHGYGFRNYRINNPPIGKTSFTEASVKQNINANNDGICGIYEGFDEQGYKLGVIKDNGNYKLIYLGSKENMSWWQDGDLKASLTPSATPGFFKASWYMANKELNNDAYVMFNGGSMETVISNEKAGYLKMYPASNQINSVVPSSQDATWSGTGFALKNGYITTNYHVIDGATTIYVRGIKGDFGKAYKAEIVATDKFNDLAIIKISDTNFTGFGAIPYAISTSTSDVGEDIFVLGYPLTSTMGDEIKLTTGVISSKTGFQGDVSLYQISAPIQPGNSGGPLFDSKGNVIGVVSAKHTGAENVGYAIKASYLKSLIESNFTANLFPISNSVSTLSLSNKVKAEKNFVFFIECSSEANNISLSSVPQSIIPNQKIYNYPSITRRGSNKLTVISVAVSDESTVLEMSDNNSYPGGYYQWFSIYPDASIIANGRKYKLRSADGIALSPSVTYFSGPNETKKFKLVFPPIPFSTSSIDFIESTDSEWKLYGINLR